MSPDLWPPSDWLDCGGVSGSLTFAPLSDSSSSLSALSVFSEFSSSSLLVSLSSSASELALLGIDSK